MRSLFLLYGDKEIARRHAAWYICAAAPRRVVIQKYRGKRSPSFRTPLRNELPKRGRGVSLFSSRLPQPPPPFSAHSRERTRTRYSLHPSAVSLYPRESWGNGFELSRGIPYTRERWNTTRGYIRLRRFLRSHSYPCGSDKTDGALLLKSQRASRIRYAEIYENRPVPSPPPLSFCGDDLSRTDSYHRVEAPRRLFDGRYRTFDNVLRPRHVGH